MVPGNKALHMPGMLRGRNLVSGPQAGDNRIEVHIGRAPAQGGHSRVPVTAAGVKREMDSTRAKVQDAVQPRVAGLPSTRLDQDDRVKGLTRAKLKAPGHPFNGKCEDRLETVDLEPQSYKLYGPCYSLMGRFGKLKAMVVTLLRRLQTSTTPPIFPAIARRCLSTT